jgi:hypothetical protein
MAGTNWTSNSAVVRLLREIMIFSVPIDSRTYEICYRKTEPEDRLPWFAWTFFAYDEELNIYPADDVPQNVKAQESILGEFGAGQEVARQAVENKLRRVIQTRTLDGTGFFSPPSGKIYPQEFPNENVE